MKKHHIKTADLYYINRRLRALGVSVSTAKKNISLTEASYKQLKRKDKKKIENLNKNGYNIQLSLV